jgi:hypothetical protein
MPEVLEFDENGDEERVAATPDKRGTSPIGTIHDAPRPDGRAPRSAKAAVAMKIAGASYADIAQVLDYVNATSARMAVEQALAEAADDTSDYKALRALESLRLDGLLKAAYPKAIDKNSPDQIAFMQKSLQIIDRQIKLHGVDAPQVISLVTPTTEEFDQAVQLLVAAKGDQENPEADIFALEQAPDGVTWQASDDDNA